MEFLPVEVYANDVGSRDPAEAACDAEDPASASGDDTSTPDGRKSAHNRANRLLHVLDHNFLPTLPDKGTAFDALLVVAEKGVFGGRHDGTIMHWKIQQSSSVTPLNVSLLHGHAGAVLAMDFCSGLGKDGLLFSASADRTIKIWDPWRGTEAEQQLHGKKHDHFCVQTLPAHQASITCLKVMAQQRNGLVSCSLDHTIKIWHAAEGRGLLLYPWFQPAQTITLTSGSWPTAMCVRDAATCSLFVGDSSGCVLHYTSGISLGEEEDDPSTVNIKSNLAGAHVSSHRNQFHLKRKHSQFHSLGVVQLQVIAENSFVVSLGFDHKAHVLDAITGAVSSTITNRNATRFTSCAWDSRGQLLFLTDAMGFLHLWNIFQDKWVKKERMFPGVAQCAKQWKVNRDVGFVECTGHKDAIVAFAVIKDEVLLDQGTTYAQQLSRKMTTSSRFFSVSLDNTLRCWDSYDMKAAFGFEERQSEITCVAASKKYAKIVTGHESGCIKAWGIHTGQYILAHTDSKSAITCLTTGMVRDQEFVIVGDVDGNVSIWELNSDCVTLGVTIHASLSSERRDEITSVMFCKGDFLAPHGGSEFLALGYQTGHIALFDFSRRVLIKAWKGHDDAVCTIARHGCFVFTGSDDATLRTWNCMQIGDPYELFVLRQPGSTSSSSTGSPIVAVDVVLESGAVLSAAADGTIIIWDYKDYDDKACVDFDSYGRILFRTRYACALRCMQYWPSQRAMICGTSEGAILVCPLPPQVFDVPSSPV